MKLRIYLLALIPALLLGGCKIAEAKLEAGAPEPGIIEEPANEPDADPSPGEEALGEVEYTIDQPYIYPLTPAMTEEWKEAWEKGGAAVYKACEVPQELLENMTTKALLQTALDYPFFVNEYAYNTREMGFDAAVSQNRALRELCKRPNATQEIFAYEMDLSHFPMIFDEDTKISIINNQLELYIELIPIYERKFKEEAENALQKTDKTYSINVPYVYPVTPSMEEWSSMNSAEQISACDVPWEILEEMTTKALLQTVLDHPLLFNLFEYETISEQKSLEASFLIVHGFCSPLMELWQRTDTMEELLAYEADEGDTLTNSYLEAMIEVQPIMYRRFNK